jgi:hypothetical protein
VTTLHDVGGELGWPLGTFFWALTISWSRLLAHEGPWPHYIMLEVSWDGLWTLSFGLSQFHGHGSWLMYEVALAPTHLLYVACELENLFQDTHMGQIIICRT